jgi:hypothetical protein
MAMNKDLQKERMSATFNTETLTELLYHGREMMERRRYLRKSHILPVFIHYYVVIAFGRLYPNAYLSRKENIGFHMEGNLVRFSDDVKCSS